MSEVLKKDVFIFTYSGWHFGNVVQGKTTDFVALCDFRLPNFDQPQKYPLEFEMIEKLFIFVQDKDRQVCSNCLRTEYGIKLSQVIESAKEALYEKKRKTVEKKKG